MAEPLISARDLVYEAGDGRFIDGVSCAIGAGRRTMVLGANGAGKSLLLRMLHGLLAPTRGQVLWRGAPLGAEARRAQAMVFQRPVMQRRSARANVEFALAAQGLGRDARRKRAEAALERAGLSHLADRPARVLSGGEMQRLALARALVTEPQVLFLDEPTASLDPRSTAAIEALILEANAGGIAIVMVTHSPGQARRLAQDVVFLHGGKVAEAGSADRVLLAPETAAAQAWIEGGLYL